MSRQGKNFVIGMIASGISLVLTGMYTEIDGVTGFVVFVIFWFAIGAVISVLLDGVDFATGDHERRVNFHYHESWGHAHRYATELHTHPFNDERIHLVNGTDNNIIDLRN